MRPETIRVALALLWFVSLFGWVCGKRSCDVGQLFRLVVADALELGVDARLDLELGILLSY